MRERAAQDALRNERLAQLDTRALTPMMQSRVHARRAGALAAAAFAAAREGRSGAEYAARARTELLAVHSADLGDVHRGEYLDALLRVGAVRWAAVTAAAPPETLGFATEPGEPGQTCLTLRDRRTAGPALARRCTYGVVWTASARSMLHGHAWVLAVQPLERWCELWVFRETFAGWTVDVLPPSTEEAEAGYVEFAGFVPRTQLLLVVRETSERGHYRRRFEELRLEDLVTARQASSPELLADFGRWQDPDWRRDSLALR
ncbi:MAG: hypothetical protein JO005_03050 [Gammaproteobacteria bacterium]|nr:hypothetical protein [Gammaproteobacteria bacterium]